MPTNDERREVAARLRDNDTRNCYTSRDVLRAIQDACGCNVGQDWQDMVELKDRLADLIEPEPERTCIPVRLKAYSTLPNGEKKFTHYNYFCSECCRPLRLKGNPSYCRHCGAKIKEKR